MQFIPAVKVRWAAGNGIGGIAILLPMNPLPQRGEEASAVFTYSRFTCTENTARPHRGIGWWATAGTKGMSVTGGWQQRDEWNRSGQTMQQSNNGETLT